MKPLTPALSTLLIVLSALSAHAQIGRRGLEDINRHRKPTRTVPILSSLDDSTTLASMEATSLPGPWDFLDEYETGDGSTVRSDSITDRSASMNLELPEPETIRERIALLPQETLVPYDKKLDAYIEEYIIRHQKQMRTILGRYRYYAPYFEKIFHEYGIPYEVAMLAVVESGMVQSALSPVGAAGLWQLMPETAQTNRLRMDLLIDERYDIEKSTRTAARYLSKMYAMFKSWPLAIAAYNCGPGTIKTAMNKCQSSEFWDIYPLLPRETRGYLPAYTAVVYTNEYAQEHGIEPIIYNPHTISYLIETNLSFKQIESIYGTDIQTIRRLNPQYLSDIVPGTASSPKKLILPRNGKNKQRSPVRRNKGKAG